MHVSRVAIVCAAAALAAAATLTQTARADDFYAGKTVSIYVGSGAGGGFDTYARVVGRRLGAHIPGTPAIKVQNRPGAGGRGNANLVYGSDPQDGTVIGALGPWLALEPLWGEKSVRFDPPKFNWLISLGREVSTCLFFNQSGVTSVDALRKKGSVVMGASGPTSAQASDAYLVAHALGVDLNLIMGFKGSRDTFTAAERGELDGNCGLWYSSIQSQYIGVVNEGRANLLLQLGLRAHPKLPDVPFLFDVAQLSDLDRKAMELVFVQMELARPYVAGPQVPQERVAILRKAFADMAQDENFLADTKKLNLEVDVVTGDEIQKLLADAYSQPKEVVDRARELIKR